MKKFIRTFSKTASRGIIFAVSGVFALGALYAAMGYNWTDPSALRNKTAGQPLQASQWNMLITNVDNLNQRLTSAESTISSLSASVPSWAVVAFTSSCPSGWSEYGPAQGRFIRGIDPSGSTAVDPSGIRASGNLQTDTAATSWAGQLNGSSLPWGPSGYQVPTLSSWGGWMNQIGETRPKNVALLYCIKN